MNKLNKLIEELCPNGVQYKTIGEIATYRRGSFPQPYTNSSYYGGEGAMPFVQVADIDNEEFKLKDKTKQTISKIAQPKSIFVPTGTVICSIQGTIGRVAITQYDAFVDRTIAIFESFKLDMNKTFFAHCIEVKFGYEKQFARGSTLKTITKEEFTNFAIPVPPIEIQNEIVDKLNYFTDYLKVLNKELINREKQLEFVMNKLLKKENFNKFETLDNICNIEKGKTPIQKNKPGMYPLVATTEYLQTSDNYQFDCEAVCLPLISSRGHGVASISRIYYQSGKFALGNILCALIPKNNSIKAEFLRHYLFFFKDQLLVPLMRGGANVALTVDSLKGVIVPIPDVSEQENIIKKINCVSKLLDKSSGLPAEIEKRQKQYEYYRNKLLSFKEVEVNE